jgi:hypothetical protein
MPQKLIVILCLLTYSVASAQVKFSDIIGQRTLQLTDDNNTFKQSIVFRTGHP